MASISIRSLDDRALAELKALAAKDNTSVNTLVLRLIDQGLGRVAVKPALRRHHDLDELAGCWKRADTHDFERAVAPFAEVDPALWK